MYIPPAGKCHETDDFGELGDFDFSVYDDIKPVELPESPGFLFKIDLSTDHSRVMGIFRALMDIGEKSERALNLTKKIIYENPSNVTAWWYRREILMSMSLDETTELAFSNDVLKVGLKSYQAWEHRKWVVSLMKSPPSDTRFVEDLLEYDARNFHAWSYIIWLSDYMQWYDQILQLTEKMIVKQKRNASAWNARTQMLKKMETDYDKECDFVFRQMTSEGGNESCCNVIRFIVGEAPDLTKKCIEKTDEILRKYPNDKSVLTLMLHLHERVGDSSRRTEICKRLMRVDVLRKRFWQAVMDNVM